MLWLSPWKLKPIGFQFKGKTKRRLIYLSVYSAILQYKSTRYSLADSNDATMTYEQNMKRILCFVVVLILVTGKASAIDCFSCVSNNGSNIDCHDPFNPTLSKVEKTCRQSIENRYGLFPAFYCIKIKGHDEITKKQIYVRTCAIDTMDNQCGEFQFEGVLYKGCITTCKTDSCNIGTGIKAIRHFPVMTTVLVLLHSSVLG